MCGSNAPKHYQAARVITSDVYIRSKRTVNICTDEEELYMRHNEWDEYARQYEVQILVDG